MVWLHDARTPEGMRVYAIGDVHGCLGALEEVHRQIEADLAARPVGDWRVVHVGDYVDRGSDSRGVVDFLIRRQRRESRILCLRGNHDKMFARGLDGSERDRSLWLMNGGIETLASYGIGLSDYTEAARCGNAAALVPEAHRAFLDGLGLSARFGDYYFVHAGIDPLNPIDRQSEHDQLWIREPFLKHRRELPAVVVHGHTPVRRVEVRQNRIGIDTGAVFGGALTCLVLEDAGRDLLRGGRLEPLPKR